MLSAGNQDSKSILKINEFLESGLKEGEISETLYGHLKGEYLIESLGEGNYFHLSEALIETTLEEAQY